MAISRAELFRLSPAELDGKLMELKDAKPNSSDVLLVMEEYTRRGNVAQQRAAEANKTVATYTMVAAIVAAISLIINGYFQYKTYQLTLTASAKTEKVEEHK